MAKNGTRAISRNYQRGGLQKCAPQQNGKSDHQMAKLYLCRPETEDVLRRNGDII